MIVFLSAQLVQHFRRGQLILQFVTQFATVGGPGTRGFHLEHLQAVLLNAWQIMREPLLKRTQRVCGAALSSAMSSPWTSILKQLEKCVY